MSWEFHCGDCLMILPTMPADSVDLVFFSPPYEDCRTYGIDFRLKGQAWVDWMVKVFVESARVSRGLVACVVEGQTRKFKWSATPALLMADLHRTGLNLRKPPIFHRVGIPGSGGPDWLRNDFEFIVCVTKPGKLVWSENTACGHPPKWEPGGEMSNRLSDGTRRNQWGRGENGGQARDRNGERKLGKRPSHKLHTKRLQSGLMELQGYDPPAIANPGNVISIPVGGGLMGGDEYASQNEAPFPEKLAEFFIKSFAPPGGRVLDPFVGSGTTVAVAERLGRNGIGIDIRQNMIDLSTKRCEEQFKLPMFPEAT
jgi:hypothetical protein